MENIWIAVWQGIVEGLTEFLPVSSTGHLILAGHLMNFYGDKAETFEIVIQLGAILAVALLYFKRILKLLGWRRYDLAADSVAPRKALTLTHVALAMAPALLLGFLLHGWIKSYLFTPETVLAGLVLGGVFMIFAEKRQPVITAKSIDELTYKQALSVGLAQCLSLWPGFSRAGATIAGGLLSGANMRAAADFSFLIAVPMMMAASGYDLLKSYDLLAVSDLPFFLTGFVVSFVVALMAVVGFLKLLQTVKLTHFAYYRFALAGCFWMYMMQSGM